MSTQQNQLILHYLDKIALSCENLKKVQEMFGNQFGSQHSASSLMLMAEMNEGTRGAVDMLATVLKRHIESLKEREPSQDQPPAEDSKN